MPPINSISWSWPKPFDAELERLYQNHHRDQFFEQVKFSVLLAAFLFSCFSLSDLIYLELSPYAFLVRIPMGLAGISLWLYIEKNPEQTRLHIFNIVLCMVAIVLAAMVALIIMAGDIDYYDGFQTGFMMAFAYMFGPLVVPIKPGTIFCLITTLIVLLLGVYFSEPPLRLAEIALELIIMTIICVYSGCQLEFFSRQSFLSQRKANEQRLTAEQATLDKTELLRNASHNLRQPMQALSSYTSALEQALDKQPLSSAVDASQKLAGAVDELLDSFNKILDISIIESGNCKPLMTEIPINRVLTKIEQHYTAKAKQKGIQLKVVIRKNQPLAICSDESMLSQIVGNLVDNAIKYATKGWVLVTTTKTSSNTLRLHIIDTGMGISPQQRHNIFKEFVRVHTNQCHETGAGLGLAYVDKAVNRLPSHRLGLNSRENLGSHFYLDMPIFEGNVFDTAKPKEANHDKDGKFILLVNANEEELAELANQLTHLGYKIEKAASAIETKQILEDNLAYPKLVITDLNLDHDETLASFIQQVHSICGHIPIFITAAATHTDDTITLLGHDYTMLKKPITPLTLARIID